MTIRWKVQTQDGTVHILPSEEMAALLLKLLLSGITPGIITRI
jgi:hypothetical protein